MSLEKVIDDKITDLLMKIDKQKLPKHVAIIMDGNGRLATRKGLPRSFGHKQGVNVLKRILKVAKNLGCKVITVYAFSTENWTRPSKEVDFLINLFSEVLKNENFTWVIVKQLLYTTQNYLVEILRGEAMNFIIARYYLNQMTYCFPSLMLQIMPYKKQVLFEAT